MDDPIGILALAVVVEVQEADLFRILYDDSGLFEDLSNSASLRLFIG